MAETDHTLSDRCKCPPIFDGTTFGSESEVIPSEMLMRRI
jgi:hypothetical protein